MMRRIILIGLLGAALPLAAFAGETTFGGFVDASWSYDAAARAGVFGLDQAELDVVHQAGERASVHADLEWLKDGEGFSAQVEQAYLSYAARCGWTLDFGRFNAPIGLEVTDPTGMYQYSHSLLFTYCAPTNLTGLKVSRGLGRGWDLAAHLSNGWDRQTADKHVTAGARLGLARGGFAGGVSALSGTEETPAENPDDPSLGLTRTVVDTDLAFVRGAWRFGGEFSLGDVSGTAGDAQWQGVTVMAHVDFSDRAGLTLRVDRLDDQDGWLFGPVDGGFQTRNELTIAPTFALDEGLGAVVELRVDHSDRDAFVDADGLPTDSAVTMAVELTGSW
jgi:hypothetical protein